VAITFAMSSTVAANIFAICCWGRRMGYAVAANALAMSCCSNSKRMPWAMCCCSKRVMYVWHSMPHIAYAVCHVHHTIYTPCYLCSYYTVPCAVYMYIYIYTYTYTCIYTMLWYTHSRSLYDTGLASATWGSLQRKRLVRGVVAAECQCLDLICN